MHAGKGRFPRLLYHLGGFRDLCHRVYVTAPKGKSSKDLHKAIPPKPEFRNRFLHELLSPVLTHEDTNPTAVPIVNSVSNGELQALEYLAGLDARIAELSKPRYRRPRLVRDGGLRATKYHLARYHYQDLCPSEAQ